MRALYSLLVLTVLAVLVLGAQAVSAGSGVKVYAPSTSSFTVESLPQSYNGSFLVLNDGLREGVYVVRVAVDSPAAIAWLNVTPSGFVLGPGEVRQVNFSLDLRSGEVAPGTYHFIFMPTLLPLNVEPYLDTFANYVSVFDQYNFTVDVPGFAGVAQAGGTVPVVFSENPERLNLVQYAPPESGDRVVTQIDRAVRINVPSSAVVGAPVNVSLTVFEGLSSRGIQLMAIAPDGDFYPIAGDSFTFDRIGRWGVIALAGDTVLLGRPVDVTAGGVSLVMPSLGTILAAVSLLLLLAIVPIWMASRGVARADPYEDVAYKAYVVKKYIEKFDPLQLRRAVGQLRQEYVDLVARRIRGDRQRARDELEELEALASLEASSSI